MINFTVLFCFIGLALSIPLGNHFRQGQLFEGDIAGVDESVLRGAAQLDNGSRKWPGGVVPYIIKANTYNPTQVKVITDSFRLIEDQTRVENRDCIKFVPWSNEANYIHIQSISGCYSYIGKNLYAGGQDVSLQVPGCVRSTGTPVHELTHALGFWHEQSRPDRDRYVTIYWANIQPGQEHNFNKYSTNVDLLGFPYDYSSIMHYQSTAFSTSSQPTIVPNVQGVVTGVGVNLSTIDVGEIRKYYNCV